MTLSQRDMQNGTDPIPAWTTQRERGSPTMLRLMTWISLRLGRRAGRCILPFIVLYFLLFATSARRASTRYLRQALGRRPGFRDYYRHVHTFASTIHDRLYLINDRFDLFDIEVHGGEVITDLLAQGRGAFLIGAHFGSFEVLRALARENLGLNVTMVMYEDNARKVNSALAAVNPMARLEIIPLGRADSMLRIRQKLQEGAIVGMLGDRTFARDDTVRVPFLGKLITLPDGPFRIAAMLQRPVIFMAGMYLGGNRYRIHFELITDFSTLQAGERNSALRQGIEKYAAILERHCREEPYNWFNFHDVWQSPAAAGKPLP
jgi:predicted LPLAT superfamily acyltransferase